MQQIKLNHPLLQFKVVLGTGVLRLTSVYRVLLLDQSPWLKNYINFNTCLHTAAKNDFEKDFLKVMNNAVFGKAFICLFVLFC